MKRDSSIGSMVQDPPHDARARAWFRDAYTFFRKNAGYIVGRNAIGAYNLAVAEQWAEENGWTCAWEPDQEEYQSGGPHDMPSEVWVCLLKDSAGNVLDCLGGIGDPDRCYVRVIEAELACGVMLGILESLKHDHESSRYLAL